MFAGGFYGFKNHSNKQGCCEKWNEIILMMTKKSWKHNFKERKSERRKFWETGPIMELGKLELWKFSSTRNLKI